MRIRSRGQHRRRLGPGFRRVWVGFALASSGDGFIYGAVPLLAVVVDPHPLAVSAVIAADSLPWLLLALPAGAFADRFERGPVMAFANIVRAAAILATAALVATDRINLALLIIVVLIPLALKGVKFRAQSAAAVLRRNLLIYGVGGLITPFIGIKLIDLILTALGIH